MDRRRQLVLGVMASLLIPLRGNAQTQSVTRVGLSHAIKSIAAAAAMARDGDVFEVEAGDYLGDVAVWTKDNITLRAVGGRVRLKASGMAAEGKAIWVMRGGRITIEGFDFSGAQVPDRNGAGIRLEKGFLTIRDCTFLHNEMGLLTSNDPDAVLVVENSEFAYNQRPDGHNHNLYVGQIARLTITGSYLHHGHIGHLIKSRAAVSQILNNRLIDGADGTASYELEFPNGGIAYVVDNTIAQSVHTENRHLISFGAEGYKWSRNEIYLANNTLVNPLRWGVFLHVAPGADAISAIDNVLVGYGSLESAGLGTYQNNRSKGILDN